jgi:hypothetical protein
VEWANNRLWEATEAVCRCNKADTDLHHLNLNINLNLHLMKASMSTIIIPIRVQGINIPRHLQCSEKSPQDRRKDPRQTRRQDLVVVEANLIVVGLDEVVR